MTAPCSNNSHVITDRLLDCVRVITDGMLRQSGREFKSHLPRRIVLPPCAGQCSVLTEALMLRVVSFLGRFPGQSEDDDLDTKAPLESLDGLESETDDEAPAERGVASKLKGVKNGMIITWRTAPSRKNIPPEARALSCSSQLFYTLLARHAVALAQQWR
jgi:hypothetical protein